MASEHTPGPWEWDSMPTELRGPDDFDTGEKRSVLTCSHADEPSEADKALIRAAPDTLRQRDALLEACERIVSWLHTLAKAADERANTRFESLREANLADAKNYRATAADVQAAIADCEATP